MRRSAPWILVAIAAIVATLVLAPLFRGGSHVAGPAGLAGQRAPLIALRDDQGRVVSLAQYRSKVVLMNLWATWCPPCREELPDLQRLYAADASLGASSSA